MSNNNKIAHSVRALAARGASITRVMVLLLLYHRGAKTFNPRKGGLVNWLRWLVSYYWFFDYIATESQNRNPAPTSRGSRWLVKLMSKNCANADERRGLPSRSQLSPPSLPSIPIRWGGLVFSSGVADVMLPWASPSLKARKEGWGVLHVVKAQLNSASYWLLSYHTLSLKRGEFK